MRTETGLCMLSIYNINKKNNNIHYSKQFLIVGILHFKLKKPKNGYLSTNLGNKDMTKEKMKELLLKGY